MLGAEFMIINQWLIPFDLGKGHEIALNAAGLRGD
jgi:hypothetical protein